MSNELEFLRTFATSARRGGFSTPGFRLDGTNGEFHRIANKAAKMNGERWAARCSDAMSGWQRVEKGKPPLYVIGRIADGYEPPPRAELGEDREDLWPHGKDPWAAASFLPFWNPETREVIVFHAANEGSKGAIANLIEAYVNNVAAHPEQTDFDPLIELGVDSYESKHGRRIFFPVFETIEWIERPAAIRRVGPPPVKMLELTATPPQPEFGTAAAPAKSTELRSFRADMDDELPF